MRWFFLAICLFFLFLLFQPLFRAKEGERCVETISWVALTPSKLLREPLLPNDLPLDSVIHHLEKLHLFAEFSHEWLAEGHLRIFYRPSVPIGYLQAGAQTTLLFDHKGRLFDEYPYFSPKRLPQLIASEPRGALLREVELFRTFLDLIAKEHLLHGVLIETIDLTAAFCLTQGARKMVVQGKDSTRRWRLIFDPTRLEVEVTRFAEVVRRLEGGSLPFKGELIKLDLRFTKWALVE